LVSLLCHLLASLQWRFLASLMASLMASLLASLLSRHSVDSLDSLRGRLLARLLANLLSRLLGGLLARFLRRLLVSSLDSRLLACLLLASLLAHLVARLAHLPARCSLTTIRLMVSLPTEGLLQASRFKASLARCRLQARHRRPQWRRFWTCPARLLMYSRWSPCFGSRSQLHRL